MLRVVRRIRQTAPLEVRATFLGAHAVARAYRGRQAEYVDLVCREMIPRRGPRRVGRFRRRLLRRGVSSPLTRRAASSMWGGSMVCGPRFTPMNWRFREVWRSASRAGPFRSTISNAPERPRSRRCAVRRTMPTLLPGAAFFLGMSYPPARAMIRAGLARGAGFGLQSRLVALGEHAHGRLPGLPSA